MPLATIVNSFVENGSVCLEVTVTETENGAPRSISYIGRVPADAAFAALSNAEKKAALVAACKAARDAQFPAAVAAPSLAGTVTL